MMYREATRPSGRATVTGSQPEAVPTVLVVEHGETLGATVGALCAGLCLRLERVRTVRALSAMLRRLRPIAVLCHAGVADEHVTRTLRAAADADLPLLLVIERDPIGPFRQALAADLARLSDVIWLDRPPTARALVAFLTQAERRSTGVLDG
jgi:hypothetical protein